MINNESIRINKYLASCGVASRRAAEEIIQKGKVSVNGKAVTDLAAKIGSDDVVEIDGKILTPQEGKVYIMMNKPSGIVTTCDDQFDRKTVLDVLGDIGLRVYPVGRLDYATEGLLLLTNDGDFARRITHPSSNIKKTYVAKLDKEPTKPQLEKLCRGVLIDTADSNHSSNYGLAKVSPPRSCHSERSEESNPRTPHRTAPATVSLVAPKTAEITITEGRNRQVRKMFEAVGLNVQKLKRTAIGNLTLGTLKPGEWKHAPKALIAALSKTR